MSLLSRKIAAAVDSNPGPGPMSVDDGPHRLTLQLTAASPIGVAFDALEFAATDKPDWSADALKAWGDRLAARVTYLMEPLVVLEVDAVEGDVELRSQAPTARDTLRSYYEVHLHREGTLRLRRVAFDAADRRRRAVTCQLTREVLERLTDDLVASVA
jgi:hypothetical protein